MKTKNSPPHNMLEKGEVLISLAAQPSEAVEQSPSPEELADFFVNSRRFSKQRQDRILAYLDSNPQAYERWIKQGRDAEQPKSASFMFLMTPYAIAAYALLLMIGAGLFWHQKAFNLEQAIDHAYQIAVFRGESEDFRQTILSLNAAIQNTERPLSLSQAGKPSDLAQAFLLGLQHDWKTFGQEPLGSDRLINTQQEGYQLGRWHTLLWTVFQQSKVLPADFWQEQLKILDHLQTHYTRREKETDAAEVRAIVFQLARLQTILQKLTEDNSDVNSYKQLEQVLAALRFALIPVM